LPRYRAGMRKDRQAVIDTEQAEIDRWFGASPFGQLFFAEDGRGWPIPSHMLAARKAEAHARLLALLDMPWNERVTGTLAIGAAMALVFFTGRAISGTTTAYAAMLFTGVGAAHAMQAWRMWLYRHSLRTLRREITAELSRSSPLTRDIATRYRRHNPWRLALHVWVGLVLLGGVLGMHFLEIGPLLIFAVSAGVAIAWLLYFASNAVDARQRALNARP